MQPAITGMTYNGRDTHHCSRYVFVSFVDTPVAPQVDDVFLCNVCGRRLRVTSVSDGERAAPGIDRHGYWISLQNYYLGDYE